MTVDDLVKVYCDAFYAQRDKAPEKGITEADRAGVTAIVRALRDEFREEYGMWGRFTKILGSDAAPAPQANTVELSQAYVSQIEQSRTEAHRNAAPAVCVWTSRGRNEPGFYSTPHGIRHMSLRHDSCVSCGNPIKFTEANHG